MSKGDGSTDHPAGGGGDVVRVPRGASLLLKVPDHGDTAFVNATSDDAVDGGVDPTNVDGASIQSYLRLGAFDFASESPAAKELLRIIPKANAASDPASVDEDYAIAGITSDDGEAAAGLVFVDDIRARPQDVNLTCADDPDHGLPKPVRRTESGKLYARGGWRDHSDGNRISTTWGDKVEVVRGNHKMIVLGRQNDPAQAMGYEASGGHIQDFAPGTMPGASYWLEWIDDARFRQGETKGAWLLVNTTENVYEFARTAGNLREELWGDVHETYVGSENPPQRNSLSESPMSNEVDDGVAGHSPPFTFEGLNYGPPQNGTSRSSYPSSETQTGKVRSNPHIIEKTWARRIDSWTGSGVMRVPHIEEKTWATDVDEYVNVANLLKSHTEASMVQSLTTAATILDTTTAGIHAEFETSALHFSLELGAAHVELEAAGMHVNIETSPRFEFGMQAGFEAQLGELENLVASKKSVVIEEAEAGVKKDMAYLGAEMNVLALSLRTVCTRIQGLEIKIGD